MPETCKAQHAGGEYMILQGFTSVTTGISSPISTQQNRRKKVTI